MDDNGRKVRDAYANIKDHSNRLEVLNELNRATGVSKKTCDEIVSKIIDEEYEPVVMIERNDTGIPSSLLRDLILSDLKSLGDDPTEDDLINIVNKHSNKHA